MSIMRPSYPLDLDSSTHPAPPTLLAYYDLMMVALTPPGPDRGQREGLVERGGSEIRKPNVPAERLTVLDDEGGQG